MKPASLQYLRRLYSRAWFLVDRTRQRLTRLTRASRKTIAGIAGLLVLPLAVAAVRWTLLLDSTTGPQVTAEAIAALMLALGATLIGAATLAFALEKIRLLRGTSLTILPEPRGAWG